MITHFKIKVFYAVYFLGVSAWKQNTFSAAFLCPGSPELDVYTGSEVDLSILVL